MLAIGAAATCGTDVKSVKRGHPTIATYPARLGHEFAGTVEAVGEGVTNVARRRRGLLRQLGAVRRLPRSAPRGRESLCEDLLYVLGGFAEKLLVPERVVAKNLHPLPAGRAARAGAAGRAARLRRARARRRGRRRRPVAILGAGSLGLMLTALVADAGG